MTPNKQEKLAEMKRLGFSPVPADRFDKHQQVRCSHCGYSIPFYRLALAEGHHCDGAVEQPVAVERPVAVELSQNEMFSLCARFWGELDDNGDDFDL